MFAGKILKIGEKEYQVPSLSLGQLRNGALEDLKKHDELIRQNLAYDAMSLRANLIILALKRNYPEVDEEEVLSNLDLENCGEIWLTVLGLSGFKPGENLAAKTETETSGT